MIWSVARGLRTAGLVFLGYIPVPCAQETKRTHSRSSSLMPFQYLDDVSLSQIKSNLCQLVSMFVFPVPGQEWSRVAAS